MTVRGRTIVALAATALIPLLLLGLGVRTEMRARLSEQVDGRIASLTRAVTTALSVEGRSVRSRLEALAAELGNDGRFRAAISEDGPDRRWLLDWAGPAMRLAGLDYLELLDSTGRIVSSGHFRNDFDRLETALATAVQAAPEQRVLVVARVAEGSLTAIVLADSLVVGGRRFLLLGGRALDSTRVAAFSPDGELAVRLVTGKDRSEAITLFEVPLVDPGRGGPSGSARIVALVDDDVVRGPIARLDRWLLLALGTVAALVGVMAWWLGAIITKPVVDLAERTERIDLDRLDQDFPTDRTDEIGVLARVLDQMTRRLRTSATHLRETERRATIGDLARQVNHDVKNGLAPIRHVVRHLTQTADRDPGALAATYQERRATLESSIEYLDGLARNYAKLTPGLTSTPSAPNEIAAAVARSLSGPGATVECRLAPEAPLVRADPIALRRILENLGNNAIDALGERPGRVGIATVVVGEGNQRRVEISVSDTGVGIAKDQVDRIFDDFYTTKAGGTGLGLSVVRRLVADLGGVLRVTSELGRGTVFSVELPIA